VSTHSAPTPTADALGDRLAAVRSSVRDAAVRSGRDPAAVTIVAVAKTFPAERVAAVADLGHADIGESRAQELKQKAPELGDRVRWHHVGQLQRNKVKDVVGTATLIHSLDRLSLARDIAERAAAIGVVQRTLLQVNVTGDPQKAGCEPAEVLALLGRVRELDHLACVGLTTIPALGSDPRAAFHRLRELRDAARARYPEVTHLSMGMSGDYALAVEEGATLVRPGEAIFGAREQREGRQEES